MVADQNRMAVLSDDRDKEILCMRAGINGEPKDFGDIAKDLGITSLRCIGRFCRAVNKL